MCVIYHQRTRPLAVVAMVMKFETEREVTGSFLNSTKVLALCDRDFISGGHPFPGISDWSENIT